MSAAELDTVKLGEALEAEWYNGNLDEDAYRRLCRVAGVKPYPSAIDARNGSAVYASAEAQPASPTIDPPYGGPK